MSCRGGAGLVRGGASALQPLRATVPFQLHSKAQVVLKDARTAEIAKSLPPKPSIRRTLSLDTVVLGPYLQGQWPKELDQQGVDYVNDKATQTPSSWSEEAQVRRGCGGHKRSASWGSTGHLREIAKLKQHLQQRPKHGGRGGHEREHPSMLGSSSSGTTQTSPVPIPQTALNRLALRHSVEALNQELEGVFVREMPEEQHRVLEVPDGHRAPVPAQRCSTGLQSEPSPVPLSSPPSPCSSVSPFPPGDMPSDLDAELLGYSTAEPSFLLLSSSPRPNKSYSFQREPPEGCERVRVSEESPSACLGQSPFPSSCPDPDKVNFTPHSGSAFCPVSLLKPLLPSMDFLLRNLSVPPVTACSAQGVGPYPPADASTTAT